MKAKEFYENYIRNRKVAEDRTAIDFENINFLLEIMASEEQRAGLDEFLPTVQNRDFPYSTDAFLNELMTRIVERAQPDVARQVAATYVVKKINYEGNAFAHGKTVTYDGHIIEYWVGLTTLLHVCSILFTDYHRLQHYMFQNERGYAHWDQQVLDEADEHLSHNIAAYRVWAERWRTDQRLLFDRPAGIRFRQESQYVYLDLTEFCVIFVLAHEIGHHLLSHTESDYSCWVSHSTTESALTAMQQRELDADIFALGVLSSFNRTPGDYHWHRLVAPYLCMFALTTLSEPRRRATTHPSLRERFLSIRRRCDEMYANDDAHAVLVNNIMHNFLRTLFKTIRHPENEWWTP